MFNPSEAQLDAAPRSVTIGSIRRTVVHLVMAQCGYLATLGRTSQVLAILGSIPHAGFWRAYRRSQIAARLARARRKPARQVDPNALITPGSDTQLPHGYVSCEVLLDAAVYRL